MYEIITHESRKANVCDPPSKNQSSLHSLVFQEMATILKYLATTEMVRILLSSHDASRHQQNGRCYISRPQRYPVSNESNFRFSPNYL